MGQLSSHGYTLVPSLDQADVCVVNSCTVKNPSESRGLHLAPWQIFRERVSRSCLAMGHNLWLHFGVDEHPFAHLV